VTDIAPLDDLDAQLGATKPDLIEDLGPEDEPPQDSEEKADE
jgi:hypothetical protein